VGVIRKTMSVTTLGIIPYRSKKERLRRAEKAQVEAAAARDEADARLAVAERRARAAELLALQEAKRAAKGKRSRKDKRQESRAALAAAEVARERRGRRARKRREAFSSILDRLEAAPVDEVFDGVKVRGRKARRRAEALVAEAGDRAVDLRDKAGDRAVDLRDKAGELREKAEELIDHS
jgi:colicin import membrane protein